MSAAECVRGAGRDGAGRDRAGRGGRRRGLPSGLPFAGAWAALAALAALGAGCGDAPDEPTMDELTAEGVSRALADWRAGRIDSLRYRLAFRLPSDRSSPVEGVAEIRYRRSAGAGPVILDFAAPDSAVRSVESRGGALEWELRGGHLVIPDGAADSAGVVSLRVEFVAGDGPLNRNDEYLYTLFVPARAREAFPCFDQPNLKGRFRLTVEAPGEWRVVSNTPTTGAFPHDSLPFGPPATDRTLHHFAETPPLPTYLFAFAAGRFQVETARRDGRTLRMFHRETDAEKVRRNRERAFELHGAALRWLEEYTGIPYPFEKFDFVLIPSFQYGGMEHPGAVLYRASRVLLDEGPTTGQMLGRASLIAHETAHMWFGDLVTMDWFDDVWMKEVFANFMAAKVVHPSFPEMDHDLRFLLDHFPPAYAVDRSGGTHPIQQELSNLADAGSLYGAIIYQKAPVVMRQLEALTGEDAFRRGARDYLRRNAWGNAGWPGLVAALDPHAELDVSSWSSVWVEEAGRPTVRARLSTEAGRIESLTLEQEDPLDRGLRWPQRVHTGLGGPDSLAVFPTTLRDRTAVVAGTARRPTPGFVVPGVGGRGYGRFVLDPPDRRRVLEAFPGLEPAVSRAATWLVLWDDMLEGGIRPEALVRAVRDALEDEPEELLVERMLADLSEAWWRYLEPGARRELAPGVERAVREAMRSAGTASRRSTLFRAFRRVAVTDSAAAWLRSIWETRDPPEGLSLSERDYSELAQALAVREVDGSPEILEAQAERISNPDRLERFRWVMPALSRDPAVRDSFFRSLSEPANRRHEPWVLEGLGWLHHPLRSAEARRYVRPALELLQEVAATGDIFFPRGWLDATFRGHGSPQVARTVRRFLEERPDYPGFLEDKILQAADPVFRAARIRSGS